MINRQAGYGIVNKVVLVSGTYLLSVCVVVRVVLLCCDVVIVVMLLTREVLSFEPVLVLSSFTVWDLLCLTLVDSLYSWWLSLSLSLSVTSWYYVDLV